VVGPKIVEELSLGPEPLGKEIYLDIYPATIIGIMEHKGQSLGMDADDIVFVPFDSAVNLFGRNAADQVQLRLQAENEMLRSRHDVTVHTNDAFGDVDVFAVPPPPPVAPTVTRPATTRTIR